jgi:tRNA pseudouridine38-40 synthase
MYKEESVFVPKMPALGLLLEQPLFESYNRRMVTVNGKKEPSNPDYRPLIDFDMHREKMEEFKSKFIYHNMRQIEDRTALYVCRIYLIYNSIHFTHRFDAWMRTVDNYSGNDFLWLNPAGIVPKESIILKGQRRENPFKERRRFNATSITVEGDKVVGLAEDEEEESTLSKKELDEMDS